MSLRDAVQELRELGLRRSLYRISREASQRAGVAAVMRRQERATAARCARDLEATPTAVEVAARWFGDPRSIRDRIAREAHAGFRDEIDAVARGSIRAFSRWRADYGRPIDWHRDPTTGARWDARAHWSDALARPVGDVKMVWEAARFPHAFVLARAAAFEPEHANRCAAIFARDLADFAEANPFPHGVHWSSGQEIAIRLLAWTFAIAAFEKVAPLPDRARRVFHAHAALAGDHIDAELHYAEHAVYNNHLIVEAAGLEIAARLRADHPHADRWRARAAKILAREADAQVYEDGGYVQHSHTYHRLALQAFVAIVAIRRAEREADDPAIIGAIRRSFAFLSAHLADEAGRLPNFGSNDGADALPLSSCDYTDFRPLLQLLSVVGFGARAFDRGAWDEPVAWLFPDDVDAPVRSIVRRSASFPGSGHHVLRGANSFAAFRCGSLRERFGQIDMLHVDHWRGGRNVLVDGGSYLYAAREWLNHFLRTGVHNTIAIDGLDQMVHARPFKTIYWTRARTLRFEASRRGGLVEGEHFGYARLSNPCVHHRIVHLTDGDDLVVVDRVEGEGDHAMRLHWLCADGAHRHDAEGRALHLSVEGVDSTLRVFGEDAGAFTLDVARAVESPPRGWTSRYYGERTPATSVVVEARGSLPRVFVTVVSATTPVLTKSGHGYDLACGDRRYRLDVTRSGRCERYGGAS